MMRTLTILALAMSLLMAGPIAGSGNTSNDAVPAQLKNVTVIAKNQWWPILPVDPLAACERSRCVDA
jgi:hypothetical protein